MKLYANKETITLFIHCKLGLSYCCLASPTLNSTLSDSEEREDLRLHTEVGKVYFPRRLG